MNCRFCGRKLTHEVIDLVNAPPSNAFLTNSQINCPEVFYPLRLFVCNSCFLVQTEAFQNSDEIFNSDYSYYSSFSKTWLLHAQNYVEMITDKFKFDSNSLVIEVASNDGYLLQYFIERGVPAIGIEPSEGTAIAARKKGVETFVDFFGNSVAQQFSDQGKKADLLIGNNVLAHVPDLNDFVKALKIILKPSGIITLEFPHLMHLIDNVQFDTIYHEHFSYFSLTTVKTIMKHHGLDIFDVEEIPTHGGSLRIYLKHEEDQSQPVSKRVEAILKIEQSKGLNGMSYFTDFQRRVNNIKYDLLDFLIKQKKKHKKVIAYGAAAKGNTLLNYCGIKKDLIAFVVDASPHKQGKYLPGSHIPVLNKDDIKRYKPDYVLILPWNIKEEIMAQLDYIRTWNGKFVASIPCVHLS